MIQKQSSAYSGNFFDLIGKIKRDSKCPVRCFELDRHRFVELNVELDFLAHIISHIEKKEAEQMCEEQLEALMVRLTEITTLLTSAYRKARIRELGFRLIA